jgi:hypothetical protein
MCVVSFAAVAEVVLRCKTTNGVVEKRFNDDAEMVYVSRSTSRALSLTHTSSSLHLQLDGLGLTEVPFALFRMKNEELWLGNNNLCSLPSDIAHLARLERLYVRLLKRFNHDLTLFSGLRQPAHISSARARSADQSQDALRAALVANGS